MGRTTPAGVKSLWQLPRDLLRDLAAMLAAAIIGTAGVVWWVHGTYATRAETEEMLRSATSGTAATAAQTLEELRNLRALVSQTREALRFLEGAASHGGSPR